MTGVFTSSAAVGAILGAGGLASYMKGKFSAEKDAKLIHTTIENRDNPDIIIKLLEIRFPSQREEIRQKYNEKYPNNVFDDDIRNYVPNNLREHVTNMLIGTNEINIQTERVRILLEDEPFDNYLQKDFNDGCDVFLIFNIINNHDNPLLIIRLLNYRNEKQRKKIDSQFRMLHDNNQRKMLLYILDFIPGHCEVPYLHMLLDPIK